MSDAVTAAIETAAASLSASETPAPAAPEATPVATPDSAPADAPAAEAALETPAHAAEGAPEVPAPAAPTGGDPTLPGEDPELSTIEADLVAKTPNLAKGKIPASRHQAVLTRTRNQYEAQIKTLKDQMAPFERPETQEALRVMAVAERDPEAYVAFLREHPHFKAAFAKAAPAAEPSAPSAAGPTITEKPQANVVLPDGSLGYDAAAAERLAEYHAQQVEARFHKELSDLRKAVDPVTKAHERTLAEHQAVQKVSAQLKTARESWPGFVDHEKAIAAELHKPGNERLSLHEAYIRVVPTAFKADTAKIEAEIRAKVLKEMAAAAPVATPPKAGNGAAPERRSDPAAPRDTEDIIRESMRRLSA